MVGLLFGVSIGVLVLLAGPLLLFNPWFVSTLQVRHEVAESFGTSQPEIDRVTGEVLGDLFTAGDFAVSLDEGPLLDESERSHMADVSRLVRLLIVAVGVAVLVAVLCASLLRGQVRTMAGILLLTASLIGGAALALAIVFALAFEPAFLAFHALFFPPGTYLFTPGSNLVTLFPGGFWFDAALMAGATVVLSAMAVAGLGVAGRRRSPPMLAAG